MTVTWNDLFTQGTLINFSEHQWRARMQLKASDLGIIETNDVKEAFSLGCHRLTPEGAFSEIGVCVRSWKACIEEHSLPFPLLEGARYVPDSEVKELEAKLNKWKAKFENAVVSFLESYQENKDKALKIIEQALLTATNNNAEVAERAFLRVLNEYPSKDKIAEKFFLEWNLFSISIPTSKEAANAAKDATGQVQKVIGSMVEGLRNELSEKVASLISMAEKAKRGTEGFADKSKESANRVLDKVDRLNILGDDTLARQVAALRDLINSDVDLDTIVPNLNQIQKNLEQDLAKTAAAAEKKLTGLGNRRIQV